MLNGIWTVSYSTNQNYHLPKHPLSLLCGKNWKINYISRLTIPPPWPLSTSTSDLIKYPAWTCTIVVLCPYLIFVPDGYCRASTRTTVMTDVKQCEISPHLSHGEIQLSPHQSCGSDLHVIARRKVEPKIEPVEKRSKNWSSVMR